MKRISATKVYYSKIAPEGKGDVLEFSGEDEKSVYFFEEEHNSSWYAFEAPISADLGFQIIPDSIRDDYDFVLYRYSGENFCDAVIQKKAKPVRTCISRNDKSIGSRTGLKEGANDSLIHSGPGKSWSKPLAVKRGEKFVLVLDNCYETGGAHTIVFNFIEECSFSGSISLEDSLKPELVEISLQNAKTGKKLKTVHPDPISGDYSFSHRLSLTTQYELIVHSPGYFFKTHSILPRKFKNFQIENLDFELPRLKEERNFKVDGLNFEPNTPILVRESIPKAKQLFAFMEENPQIHIEIEGHTNCAGNYFGPTYKDQPLSEARAKAIYDYLLRRGIEGDRITRIGYGCSRMLFPNARTLDVQLKNMRVEVKITSLGE